MIYKLEMTPSTTQQNKDHHKTPTQKWAQQQTIKNTIITALEV